MPENDKIACLLVPGVAVTHPMASSLERLRPYLAPWRVVTIGTGFTLFGLFRRLVARRLRGFCEKLAKEGYRVVLIGHSQGATICARATEIGAPCDVFIAINAAYEDTVRIGPKPGPRPRWVHYYLKDQWILRIAGRIPHPVYGDGGTKPMPRADVSFNLADFGVHGHSIPTNQALDRFGPHLRKQIKAQLKA